jgi:XFP C-terminal domain
MVLAHSLFGGNVAKHMTLLLIGSSHGFWTCSALRRYTIPAFFSSLLVQDVVDRLPHLGSKGAYLKQQMQDKLIEHKQYINKHGEDLPEIRNWKWNQHGTQKR